jgi:hypothetical protein
MKNYIIAPKKNQEPAGKLLDHKNSGSEWVHAPS